MITLKLDFDDATGLIVGYEVAGHAGMAETGKDIICAAVSAITQTPLLGLERHLKRHPVYQVSDGVLKVKLDKADELSQAILMSMYLSVQDVSQKYPNYVRILEQR